MEDLVTRWGYLVILLGTFLEGESVLFLGGAMAHRGLLTLPGVIVSAFLGSVAGDQLWFVVGARFGRGVLERRPRWRAGAARAESWLTRFGTAYVLGFRFLYGLRTASPLLFGASGYSMRRFAFACLNVPGAAAWAASFAALGWGLGEGLRRSLGRNTRWEELGALGAVVVVSFTLAHLGARRRLARSGGGEARVNANEPD